MLDHTPLKIKEASIAEEEQITKAFYKDYSLFKRELYRDLIKRNSKNLKQKPAVSSSAVENDDQEDRARLEKNVRLSLFKKSQKLIDRFLFIFFAEDRMLLPSNSTLMILNKWRDDWDFGDERPLYGLFKQYFKYLDEGRKGTEKRAEIYAYNGGLFKPDAILDALEIDDDLLYTYTRKLSNYDFESQVDVNILGHIFENSLNEIESVNAEIEGGAFDKQTSKRKKDGVFYTPKYITKYIVENTVGKLCTDKKLELGLDEEQYFKGRKNRNKTTIETLVGILATYRDWLLQITICDPACGSGAFLNQALDFLIREHTYIDELKARVLGGGLQFPHIENTILENNIYGVDLNEESVEIAKLSLWLRTAQPRRKLNDLSSNIKCGNSLIEDKMVAGDKAFTWETAFAKVFEQGGFDVVIGNLPYAYRNAIDENVKEYFLKRYQSTEGNFELYKCFIEKSVHLLNDKGIFSFITSSSFLLQKSFTKLRQFILKSTGIVELMPLGPGVFDDATVDTAILILSKDVGVEYVRVKNPKKFSEIETTEVKTIAKKRYFDNSGFVFDTQLSESMYEIIDKVVKKSKRIDDLFELGVGINTGYIKSELVSEHKIDERYHLMIPGSGISKYGKCISEEWILYDREFVKNKGKLGRSLPEERFFNQDKILIVRTRNLSMSTRIVATIDLDKKYNLNRLSNIISKDGNSLFGLLAYLNSNFFNWLFSTKFLDYEIKPIYLRECPIVESGLEILKVSAKQTFLLTTELEDLVSKFVAYLSQSYSLVKVSRKLENWQDLTFSDFIKELNKAIKTTNTSRAKENLAPIASLTKKEEFEWMPLFEENKKKAQELQSQITAIEREINLMVYELYGLTEEEIVVVEA